MSPFAKCIAGVGLFGLALLLPAGHAAEAELTPRQVAALVAADTADGRDYVALRAEAAAALRQLVAGPSRPKAVWPPFS